MQNKLSRTLINPTHGYKVTFLECSSETNGEYTFVEVTLPPNEGTPLHYHLNFTEEFEAVEGKLGLQLGKKFIYLNPGDAAAQVPIRVNHRFFNPGEKAIKFRAMIRPANNFETMLRVSYGLAEDGLCKKNGIPKNPLILALVYEISESFLPGLPIFVQKGIFGMLARLARHKNLHKTLEKYYVGILEPKSELVESV